MSTTRLFVYGTLRHGEPNHAMLEGAPCQCEATTPPRYRLVSLGAYPGMLEGGRTSVRGEIYVVPRATVMRLDVFEEHPKLFVRQVISLGPGVDVETYLLVRSRARGAQLIAGGDWCAFIGPRASR